MEYESNYDITDLIAALEPMMNSHIAMVLLPCDVAQFSGRYLTDDVGLVALDSNPVDQVDTTGTKNARLCGVLTPFPNLPLSRLLWGHF